MLRETIYILIHPVSFIDRHHGEAVGARIFAIVYLHSTSTFQVRCEVTKERETDLPVFYYRGHELLTFHSFFVFCVVYSTAVIIIIQIANCAMLRCFIVHMHTHTHDLTRIPHHTPSGPEPGRVRARTKSDTYALFFAPPVHLRHHC